MALVEGSLIVVGFVVLFFGLPHALFGDDPSRFDDIQRLIHHGELSDGPYSLVMPLLSAPFQLLVGALGKPEMWAATRFNVIVVAAGTLAALGMLRGRAEPALLRKVVLVLLFASFMTNRLRDYNAEVLTATLATLGIIAITTRRRVWLGWALIVIGVVNTPGALGGLALLAVVQVVRERRLRWLLAPVAAVLLVGAEAWIRRGSPTDTGYGGDHGFPTMLPYSGRPGFSYPFLLGVASILFSFGRGLMYFAPGLMLWLLQRTRELLRGSRELVLALGLFLAGLVLAYAKWWAWYAGVAWGPRFFTFAAVPASLFLAVRLYRPQRSFVGDGVTLLVLVLSGWVAVTGALGDMSRLSVCFDNNYALEAFCWYVPEYSGLWQPFLGFPKLTTSSEITLAFCAVVFVWLAVPIVAGMLRSARDSLRSAEPLRGWQI